jgi:hypothetical protein
MVHGFGGARSGIRDPESGIRDPASGSAVQ